MLARPIANILSAAVLSALLLVPPIAAATDDPGECAPPRTRVAILPLADRTDRTWELLSGQTPAVLVLEQLADSLEHGRGRRVLIVPAPAELYGATTLRRPLDDDQALRALRHADAEIAITGTVSTFIHEDVREGGKLGRWGVGAP